MCIRDRLITYPRTGSRYIPEDVFAEIPKLLAFIGTQPEWKDKAVSYTHLDVYKRQAYQCIARYKFSIYHVSSELFAHQAESEIGDILHRSQKYRACLLYTSIKRLGKKSNRQ